MTDETRSREDEYFWRRDQELIDKMRRRAANEQAVRELGTRAGLDDPELIQELAALGFTIGHGRPSSADAAHSNGVDRSGVSAAERQPALRHTANVDALSM